MDFFCNFDSLHLCALVLVQHLPERLSKPDEDFNDRMWAGLCEGVIVHCHNLKGTLSGGDWHKPNYTNLSASG